MGTLILFAIFLALREFNCWYWKINQRIKLQEENNLLLKRLIEKNEKQKAPEVITRIKIQKVYSNRDEEKAALAKKLGLVK